MKIFLNLLQRFAFFLFPQLRYKKHTYVEIREPKIVHPKHDPERWVKSVDPETGQQSFTYTYTEIEARAMTINQILCDLQRKQKLIVTNFVDEKCFEEIVYILNHGLNLDEEVLVQKKKLKPKYFEAWLLEKINSLSIRLEITRDMYV